MHAHTESFVNTMEVVPWLSLASFCAPARTVKLIMVVVFADVVWTPPSLCFAALQAQKNVGRAAEDAKDSAADAYDNVKEKARWVVNTTRVVARVYHPVVELGWSPARCWGLAIVHPPVCPAPTRLVAGQVVCIQPNLGYHAPAAATLKCCARPLCIVDGNLPCLKAWDPLTMYDHHVKVIYAL